MAYDETKCCKMISHWNGWRMSSTQCTRKGLYAHDGNLYCKQHDPKEIAKRQEQRNAEHRRRVDASAARYRLESAAPDLFDACKALLECWYGGGERTEPEDRQLQCRAYELASAAIAKAEGGAK